jgi:hypothetical protein
VGQVSPDGLHQWDGQRWQPVDQTQVAESSVGQVSPDGLHQWDGQQWQPVDQTQPAGATDQGQQQADGQQGTSRPTVSPEEWSQLVAASYTILADGDETTA